jgi:hypothetical protein
MRALVQQNTIFFKRLSAALPFPCVLNANSLRLAICERGATTRANLLHW